ncbi:Hypothetical protein MVR_LOCUS147 [uncultured virus]|nr:Hypothetical protein MVR_LOCUS147 [uncultured virus]
MMRATVNHDSSIYSDAQNVHDSHVQQTITRSIANLLADPKPSFSIEATRVDLAEDVIKLVTRYCEDESVHSQQHLTYLELLGYVWARICRSEHKTELIRIFEEQIRESRGKCFTGRFNRTVSVLMGFYDDIVIAIADSSRIGAIIVAIKGSVLPYDPKVHQERAKTALTEAGYDDDTIIPWLEAIV